MRVAVVHDWLVVSGGAEKVTRELLRTYDADLFALVDFLDDTDRTFITGGRHARTSFIQRLPFARRHFRNYLPLFPMAMERLDLGGYDLIVSASYAVAKGVRKRPGQKHVCYIHTPMRWAWVKEEEYLRDHRVTGPKAALLRWQLDRLRRWDLRTNAGVDRFVANSANVADRVKRHYGREADVLLPPVDLDLFPLHTGPREQFITASRLVPYKHTDRIVEAFRSLPDQRLVVTGDGPELERLRRSAPANVRFTGHVGQQELVHLLQRARALIVAADEDLGLTPLEAQACGTPVIALRKGGYLETVPGGLGCRFFNEAMPDAIGAAVRSFLEQDVPAQATQLRDRITPFSSERFRERFRQLCEATLQA